MEMRSRSAAAPQRGRSPSTASVITRELSVSIKKLFTDRYPLLTCVPPPIYWTAKTHHSDEEGFVVSMLFITLKHRPAPEWTKTRQSIPVVVLPAPQSEKRMPLS